MSKLATTKQLSRQEVAGWIAAIVEAVENGDIEKEDALQSLIQIGAAVESGEKQLRVRVMDEAEKAEGQKYEKGGYVYQMVDGRRILDYSGDQEWQMLKAAIDRREADMKNAFNAYLKGNRYLSPEGEEVPLPAVKASKAFLRIERSRK